MKDVDRVEVIYSLEQLSKDGLDFGERKVDTFAEEAGEVVLHVLEDEEGGAPEEVALIRAGKDDFP